MRRLGDMPNYCAPTFVGPLDATMSSTCEGWQMAGNLQAGVDYRDALLSAPISPTSSSDGGKTLLWILGGMFVFALVLK